MTCDLAGQGGLPSVRLQPSHGTPSQLRVTSWGPLCCSVYALCNCWSVVYRRAPGTTRYSAKLPTKAGAPCTLLDCPSPPEICWGPGKSRAPPPNSLCLPLLQPALSVSGLSWSWLSAWVWVWVLDLFFPPLPPVLPLHHRPFQPFPPAHTASISLFRASLFSSRRLSSDRLEDPSPLPD